MLVPIFVALNDKNQLLLQYDFPYKFFFQENKKGIILSILNFSINFLES